MYQMLWDLPLDPSPLRFPSHATRLIFLCSKCQCTSLAPWGDHVLNPLITECLLWVRHYSRSWENSTGQNSINTVSLCSRILCSSEGKTVNKWVRKTWFDHWRSRLCMSWGERSNLKIWICKDNEQRRRVMRWVGYGRLNWGGQWWPHWEVNIWAKACIRWQTEPGG